MRALDGTYWRVRSNDETIGEYSTIELAYPMASQLSAEYPNVTIVRIRPRMSIVKAVRLLTEARKQGVELWMQEQGDDKSRDWYYPDDIFDFHAFTGSQVSSKWIVATPEDARRIDARGKK